MSKPVVGSEEYHLRSIRCAFVREAVGGREALNSSLFQDAVLGLKNLGYSDNEIIEKAKPYVKGLV